MISINKTVEINVPTKILRLDFTLEAQQPNHRSRNVVLQFQYGWTTPNMLLCGRQQILSERKETAKYFTYLGPVS